MRAKQTTDKKELKKRRKLATFISLFGFIIFAAAGCQKPAQQTTGQPSLAAEKLVNIHYLAGRLGMTVSQADNNKNVFTDINNTVTIYPKNDLVYVNNNYLA